MRESFRDTIKRQNQKLIPSTFKRGVITNVYVNMAQADVIIVGDEQTILKGIPLSSAINPKTIIAGDQCRIDMFDETNPNDMVIAYVYGRSQPKILTSFGSNSINNGTTSITFNHYLGFIPDSVQFSLNSNSGDNSVYVSAFDKDTITISSNGANTSLRIAFLWIAYKF